MAARNYDVLAKYRADLFELACCLARLLFTRIAYNDEMWAPGLKPNFMLLARNRSGEGKTTDEENRA
jgi:hypothetical protein